MRASLVDPDVLVLDEATSSVDALTEVRIGRALDKLAAGRTTIAIAHRLSTAARADRVMVLEHGRLVEDGPHAKLLTAGGRVLADVRGVDRGDGVDDVISSVIDAERRRAEHIGDSAGRRCCR